MKARKMAPTPIDLLIDARYIIPVEPFNTTLEHHSVAIRGGRIVDIIPSDQARLQYAASETVNLPEHIVTPGLINLHTHAAMTLMRGLADDLPLMRWLQEAIWPAETKHVSHAFVRDGSLLAGAKLAGPVA